MLLWLHSLHILPLKHCVVVDQDIDIFNGDDIEYAIATEVKGDEDILILPGARGSSLESTRNTGWNNN